MFFSNIFSLSDRHRVCELAYTVTRADLRRRADVLEPLLKRFGLVLRRDVLEDESRTLWATVGARPGSRTAVKRDAPFGRRRTGRKRAPR
jgi:hypothetical protein